MSQCKQARPIPAPRRPKSETNLVSDTSTITNEGHSIRSQSELSLSEAALRESSRAEEKKVRIDPNHVSVYDESSQSTPTETSETAKDSSRTGKNITRGCNDSKAFKTM